MKVKFTSTTSSKLSELTITNGQLIYLQDVEEAYYDVNNSRKRISNFQIINSLSGTGRTGTLYVLLNESGNGDLYIWDNTSSQFIAVSGYAATSSSRGTVKPDGTTITIDANGTISVVSLPASSVTYTNTVSGLSATNAQSAIDEAVAYSSTLASDIAALALRIAALEDLMPWQGTRSDWDSMSSSEQAKYKLINIIDE